MKPRSQRRRDDRRGGSAPSPIRALAGNGLLIAGLIGVGVAIIVVGILLLAGGSGGGEDAQNDDGVQKFADGSTPIPIASPSSDDEVALEALAERLIDLLPQGMWADLYEDFTDAFKERCSRNAFIATGNLSAQEQGAQLTLIRYIGVNDFSIQATTATLVIVGQLGVTSQYTVRADFEKVGDTWKISPVPDSKDCEAFSRLTG